MQGKRRALSLLAAAIGMAAALSAAPVAMADEYGGGSANNPLLPGCERVGGGGATGGADTECASPGNSSTDVTPNDLGVMGAFADGGWGMWGW